MPSCNDVHDWLDGKGFETKQDALEYIKKDYPTYNSNPNLYDCIGTYDFEFTYVVYFHRYPKHKDGTRREGGYYQLHKIQISDKAFVPLGLDIGARNAIMQHLRGA